MVMANPKFSGKLLLIRYLGSFDQDLQQSQNRTQCNQEVQEAVNKKASIASATAPVAVLRGLLLCFRTERRKSRGKKKAARAASATVPAADMKAGAWHHS
jgi:ABC-type spermidine/putrescine transport system permease subunit II